MRICLLQRIAPSFFAVVTSAPNQPTKPTEAHSGDLADCARIRVVSGGCEGNKGFREVYVDNMHKNQAVRATVRKHSQQGDDDTEYAIAEGGQLFIGCGEGGTSFEVVGCQVLKGKAEKGD